MTSNNEDEINASMTDAILKATSMLITRGCRRKYKPFWNKELEVAVQTREKKHEKTPTIPNKIAYNRASGPKSRDLSMHQKEINLETPAQIWILLTKVAQHRL